MVQLVEAIAVIIEKEVRPTEEDGKGSFFHHRVFPSVLSSTWCAPAADHVMFVHFQIDCQLHPVTNSNWNPRLQPLENNTAAEMVEVVCKGADV